MQHRRWLGSAVVLAAVGVGVGVRADTLRCDNKLLRTGDSKYDARALCGEPDAAEQRVETRTVRHQVAAPCPEGSRRKCASFLERTIDVRIDVWTYDFGPQRFVQYVTFEDDRVVRIQSGNYGHKRR